MNGLVLAWALVGGLRADVPADYPTQYGLGFDARWSALDDAWLGVGVSWAGGVNEQNPNKLRIAQRVEAAALIGGRARVTDRFGLGLGARAGLMAAFGWPRGFLPNLQNEWGPWLAAEARADFALSKAWRLEPKIGLGGFRVVGAWQPIVYLGVDAARLFGD